MRKKFLPRTDVGKKGNGVGVRKRSQIRRANLRWPKSGFESSGRIGVTPILTGVRDGHRRIPAVCESVLNQLALKQCFLSAQTETTSFKSPNDGSNKSGIP
jgi:hypothetical protein